MMYLQYSALHTIFHAVPELSRAPPAFTSPKTTADLELEKEEGRGYACLVALREFVNHAAVYARQRSFLPGLALAMLYLTVLSFHMTMIAYLMVRQTDIQKQRPCPHQPQTAPTPRPYTHTPTQTQTQMRGLPIVFVGLLQGAASLLGILGTLSYDFLASRIGTVRARVCTHRVASRRPPAFVAVFVSRLTYQRHTHTHRRAPASCPCGCKWPA